MLNIHEIEEALRKAHDAAHEEYLATSNAYLADSDNPKLQLADAIATEKVIALSDALDTVTQISWHSDETAEQIVNRIVKAITFKAEYSANKLYEDIEAKSA